MLPSLEQYTSIYIVDSSHPVTKPPDTLVLNLGSATNNKLNNFSLVSLIESNRSHLVTHLNRIISHSSDNRSTSHRFSTLNRLDLFANHTFFLHLLAAIFISHLSESHPHLLVRVSPRLLLTSFLCFSRVFISDNTPLGSITLFIRRLLSPLPSILHFLLRIFFSLLSTAKSISIIAFHPRPTSTHSYPSGQSILFVTPFAHFNLANIHQGVYISDYWDTLLQTLNPQVHKSFLHIPAFHPSISTRQSLHTVALLNQATPLLEQHNHLLSYSTFSSLLLAWFSYCINTLKSTFFPSSSSSHFSSHFSSLQVEFSFINLVGSIDPSVHNYFQYLHSFKSYFLLHGTPSTVIYPYESLPWEQSLLDTLATLDLPTKVIAFQHTTVRKWDLRYTRCPCFSLSSPKTRYIYAVSSYKLYNTLSSGNNPSYLFQVEALRLLKYTTLSASSHLQRPRSILIFGDHLSHVTQLLVSLVSASNKALRSPYSIFIRQHPAFAIPLPTDTVQDLTHIPLRSAIYRSQILIFSPTTSISLLAHFLSSHTSLYYHPTNALDSNPLADSDFPRFSCQSELVSLLSSISQETASKSYVDSQPPPYLLDPSLRNWSYLLSS